MVGDTKSLHDLHRIEAQVRVTCRSCRATGVWELGALICQVKENSREDRAKTLVLDATRQGRQELTDAIRAALVTDGTLSEDAMVAIVLESRDLNRPQA